MALILIGKSSCGLCDNPLLDSETVVALPAIADATHPLFAYFDRGDLPVYYFHRRLGGFLMLKEWAKYPVLLLREHKPMQYLVEAPGFDEMEFLGQVMGIATAEDYPTTFAAYMQKSTDAKAQFFKAWGEIRQFNDMDVALSILDS